MIPVQTTSQADFFALFSSLSKQQSSLIMTKSFRGIILEEKITPNQADLQHVIFQAKNRAVCAALEGYVHLHSPKLLNPVRAQVKDISISKAMFALTNFSYLENEWQDRRQDRVQPEVPTYVKLHCQSKELRASMLDVSVNGMGLLVGNSADCDVEFESNSCVRADFETTPGNRWIKLGGAIHYKRQVSRSIVRLGIRLYPKIEQARQLEKYVARRKKEIMEELDQAYLNASLPLGVEFQYF